MYVYSGRDGSVIWQRDGIPGARLGTAVGLVGDCLLYTSDAADERSSVDLGGRRIIKKNKHRIYCPGDVR